jgi:hypothetical protein
MISIVSGLVVMASVAATPLVALVHRGSWSPEQLMLPVGFGLVGVFALAILFRAQKLGPDESLLSGPFGLAIALAGIVALASLGALFLWPLWANEVDDVDMRGVALCAVGIVYLARSIYVNLTSLRAR